MIDQLNMNLEKMVVWFDERNEGFRTRLHKGAVSFWMCWVCLVLAVYMAQPTTGAFFAMMILGSMLFLTRWMAKFEERHHPKRVKVNE